MRWHFSPLLADQVETEITQRDQFDNDQVDIAETIIREAVQNSLDAGADREGSVKVTFRWINVEDGLDKQFFKSLFDGQLNHAEAAGIVVEDIDFDQPEALVIEDFGTCGLTGSVDSKDDENFSDFWRRHGKSHKTGKSRGRWGLGKLVYSTTSRIGTFFGLTRRDDDSKNYLMGQTVLNLREVDGKQYPPHAFFADLINEDDVYTRMPVPLNDESYVRNFSKQFKLQRSDDTGLSVVIPFPDESFNAEQMIGVAIANYFYPLITGQLVLQFDNTEVNSENVRELALKYAADRFHEIDLLFDFISEVNEAEKSSRLELNLSWLEDKKLDEDDFEPEVLETIRKKYAEGDLVGLYLPVTIKSKRGGDLASGFSVYIKRPTELVRGLDLYVRGGLTLPAEAKFRDRRALGAMIAEEEPICAFLGDAENPAHTQWVGNTEKLKNNYRNVLHTQKLVSVIKKSVVQLYDLLAEVTEEEDIDALQEFFWFDEPKKDPKKQRQKPKPPTPVTHVTPIEPKAPKLFNLSKQSGGFTITGTDSMTADKLPKEITIITAYEVARGNAFKKYKTLDFSVGTNGDIQCEKSDSVKVKTAGENKWVLEIKEPEFRFSAIGFDENRDLKIKTY